jgi:hypothetical protein
MAIIVPAFYLQNPNWKLAARPVLSGSKGRQGAKKNKSIIEPPSRQAAKKYKNRIDGINTP